MRVVSRFRPAAADSSSPQRVLLMSWTESRPVMQGMFIVRFLSCAVLAGAAGHHLWAVTGGAVSWLCTAISVYVFNGVMDRPEDVANGKKRPIATGRLSVRTAMRVVAITAVLGLAGSLLVGLWVQVVVLLALGYVYSAPPWPAKRFGITTSLVIGGMALATFWAGAEVGGGINAAVVVFAVVMSAWIGVVGAFLKDVGDAPGDAAAGRRTFAVVHGAATVLRWVAVLALTIGSGGLVAGSLWATSVLPAMAVLTAGAVWVALRCRGTDPHQQDKAIVARPYHASFLVQYATCAVAIAAALVG
jgi:4-hydroxybenzoate polyprenyltransferase